MGWEWVEPYAAGGAGVLASIAFWLIAKHEKRCEERQNAMWADIKQNSQTLARIEGVLGVKPSAEA